MTSIVESLQAKDFLSLADLSQEEFAGLLASAAELKSCSKLKPHTPISQIRVWR
ncbi:MAG: hypothetical protein R2880_07490 [Deinococcales bacterium]